MGFGPINRGIKVSVMHKASSITLEMVVASAAPLAPIWGAPNKPKIKTAFKITLEITALKEIHAPATA